MKMNPFMERWKGAATIGAAVSIAFGTMGLTAFIGHPETATAASSPDASAGDNSGGAYAGIRQLAAQGPRYGSQHNADKLVPILSVGNGTRIGAALVTGPSSQVSKVAAVGQIEVVWKKVADARILVPVSNPKVTAGLTRVPEVSVYAVGNYKL